jgi:hypothetical protein
MPIEDVQALDYYKIPEPDLHTAKGQSDPPSGYTIRQDGTTITIPWGETIQASSHCAKPGSPDHSPTKVRVEVLQDLADNGQLEFVESGGTTSTTTSE